MYNQKKMHKPNQPWNIRPTNNGGNINMLICYIFFPEEQLKKYLNMKYEWIFCHSVMSASPTKDFAIMLAFFSVYS